MKSLFTRAIMAGAVAIAGLSLSACNNSLQEKAATAKAEAIDLDTARILREVDARTDALENRAEALDRRLDGTDSAGEEKHESHASKAPAAGM